MTPSCECCAPSHFVLGWVTFLTVPRHPTSERKQVANSLKTGSLSLRLDWHWTTWVPKAPRVVSSSCQNAWIGASLEETPQG